MSIFLCVTQSQFLTEHVHREQTDDYVSHGEKVVKEFQENHGGLIELEKIWRQHFLTTMKPKFLPSLWSVSHNEDRLKIRASEGRVEKEDLVVAGLTNLES